MYFKSRTAAGKELATQLTSYRYEDTVVLALSPGGVVVGAQIAAQIHCPLMFLLTKDIILPGESSVLGVVDQNGGFTYNDMFSAGELEAFTAEYHGVIEQQKMNQWHDLNRILGDGGILDNTILKDRSVILVSDGFLTGVSLIAATNFLKPIRVVKTIVATPIATIAAVDKMHLLADELHVLSVNEGHFELDHYYEKNDIPPEEDIIKTLNEAILHWK